MNKNKTMIAHAVGVFTAIIWGTTFISTKVLLKNFEPTEVLIYRFVIGYLALALIRPRPMAFKGWINEFWFAMAGFSGVTIYFLCENVALTHTLVSNVGVIVSTAPMFTALLAFVFLKSEKPTLHFFMGFIVSIAGILLINYNGRTELHVSPIGDLLAVAAALVWAVYSIILKKHLSMKEDIIAATRRIIFYGIITMIPSCLLIEGTFSLQKVMVPVNFWNLLYLGVGATAICYFTWNWTVEKIGAVKASVYIYLVPAITIFASVLILKEKLTPLVLIGAILTVVGLLISER